MRGFSRGGTAVGASNASASEYDLQTRYDVAYTQCMYSLGNTVQSPPPGGYDYYGYAAYGYPGYGYPWYGYPWGWSGVFVGGVFAFDGGHNFDHHFHQGFHEGFARPFPESFHGGFHGGGGFHR
jgi:hypothetical protein